MSTSKLTDQQVVERLAHREGYTVFDVNLYGTPISWLDRDCGQNDPPNYLHDHAALQRVMRMLTPDELKALHNRLQLEEWPAWQHEHSTRNFSYTLYLLLLPTADLARLVAEVLPS